MVEVQSDDEEWYVLPELGQTAPTAASNNPTSPRKPEGSDVEGSDLDVLWLRFLSSPLLSARGTGGGEDTCNCRRSTKPPEQKQEQESPEKDLMFQPIGESRNGLSLAEAFAAQHPQFVRRSKPSITREHRTRSAKPEPARFEDNERRRSRPVRSEERVPRTARFEERPKVGKLDQERLSKARERKNRIKTFQKEVLDQIRDQSSSKHRPSK